MKEVLAEFQPRRVLDVGCNTGAFSVLAAQQGAQVVGIDQDAVVVGALWRKAQAEKLDILPLVNNLGRPSPAMGWRNQECASFLDRAHGQFDAVFMLAVLHHMLVSERLPLEEILALASTLTTNLLVIEFVAPEDPMFRRIVRGREHLFAGLTTAAFEVACQRHFRIVRSHALEPSSRRLYLLARQS